MNNTSWQKALKRAGLPQLRLHDLKDTVGRRLRAARVSFEHTQGGLTLESDRDCGGGVGGVLFPRPLYDAMYARSACASCAASFSFAFTRSPIDTSPSSLPSSTIGR